MSTSVYFYLLARPRRRRDDADTGRDQQQARRLCRQSDLGCVYFVLGRHGRLVCLYARDRRSGLEYYEYQGCSTGRLARRLLGAFFVTRTVILAPRIGVAMTFSLIVAGQMLITLLLDQFGFLGLPVKEISFARVGGILLITAGVVMIRRF